jgi:RNA polymerase sigma-70 factor (ECF subfamily)
LTATDEELMASVQANISPADATAAFTRLLDRHLGPLQGFLYRLTFNAADADDLAQEAFLRVWQHASRWQPNRVKFTTWLYHIARNLAIDQHRKRRDTDNDTSQIAAAEPAAENALDAETRRREVRRAVAELPERQRTALLLCQFQGMSNKDAAETLEVSVDALESLLARARRNLKDTLQPLLEQSHE